MRASTLRPSVSRRTAVGGIAGAAALLATGHAVAQGTSVVVTHAQGRTTLPAAPRRVAVYDLAALDILQALGVEPVGVPDARFPAYLRGYEAERYAKIGPLFEPDVAALRATRPDLIVVSGRSSGKYAELSRIAPTIDLSTSTTAFLGSVARNILLLGRVFDRQPEAAARTEELLAAVQRLHAKSAKAGKGLLLFVAGQGISPQPPQTRFGIFYEWSGIEAAVSAVDLPPTPPRAPRLQLPVAGTPEAAAADAARQRQSAQQAARLAALLEQRAPDWLFVLDRNAATGGDAVAASLLADTAAVARSSAWVQQKVVYLDAPTWYLVGGGLTALHNAIAQIGVAFDGKA